MRAEANQLPSWSAASGRHYGLYRRGIACADQFSGSHAPEADVASLPPSGTFAGRRSQPMPPATAATFRAAPPNRVPIGRSPPTGGDFGGRAPQMTLPFVLPSLALRFGGHSDSSPPHGFKQEHEIEALPLRFARGYWLTRRGWRTSRPSKKFGLERAECGFMSEARNRAPEYAGLVVEATEQISQTLFGSQSPGLAGVKPGLTDRSLQVSSCRSKSWRHEFLWSECRGGSRPRAALPPRGRKMEDVPGGLPERPSAIIPYDIEARANAAIDQHRQIAADRVPRWRGKPSP